MADMVTFCSKHLPGIRPIMVNSGPYHNAGATAVQELACVIAAGTEYLRALVARGISADTAAFSMTFAFSVSTNLFMEIAKLRAARGLWAKVVKAFGVENPDAQKMFLHARTSAFTKSVLDPHGNMIRGTIEGFAAAVGGCNSLYTAPFDEPIGRPDEFSMRIARNQQLLLLEEAYLGRVVDPAGGSYYVESLTDSLGREAWKLVQEYEAQGGFAAALKAGGPQKAIEAAAAKKREQIRLRRATQVGVSSSPNPKEKLIEKSHISRDAFIEERKRRIARLKAVRRSKDLQLSLQALIEAVRTHRGNLLELAVECAAEGATIGEIIRSLRTEGEVPHVAPLAAWRAASEFEGLRHRAAAFAKKTGALPKVFLVPMGPATMRRARAEFCHGFFGSGGFDVVEPAPFKTPEDAAKAILESGAGVAVLCSDDPSYPQIVPAPAQDLPPFLRGPRHLHPTMYVGVAPGPSASTPASPPPRSNAFYRRNLAAGQKGLSVAFDLATHRGYDSDHPRVVGDVGKAGVAIDSILDMKILFDGIPLDKMSVSMTMNGAVLPIMAFYIVAAEEQGVKPSNSRARSRTTSSRSSWCATPTSTRPSPSMRIIGDIFAYTSPARCRSSTPSPSPATTCRRRAPPPTSSSPTPSPTARIPPHRHRRASTIDDFAPRLSFFWAIGMNYFMEIAKMRAARCSGPSSSSSSTPRTQVDGPAHPLPDQRVEPDRAGPVQQRRPHLPRGHGRRARPHPIACTPTPSTRPSPCPTDFSARIARNTQLFLQDETGICRVVDPWGGSYYVETLTHELARAPGPTSRRSTSWAAWPRPSRPACPRCASKRPPPAARPASTPAGDHRRRQQVPARPRRPDRHPPVDNTAVREQQIARWPAARRARRTTPSPALDALTQAAAAGEGNLLELAVDAARARATLGEISGALEKRLRGATKP
jgi:methylmalonyl-CoA mutase N-terminal domain/subunit